MDFIHVSAFRISQSYVSNHRREKIWFFFLPQLIRLGSVNIKGIFDSIRVSVCCLWFDQISSQCDLHFLCAFAHFCPFCGRRGVWLFWTSMQASALAFESIIVRYVGRLSKAISPVSASHLTAFRPVCDVLSKTPPSISASAHVRYVFHILTYAHLHTRVCVRDHSIPPTHMHRVHVWHTSIRAQSGRDEWPFGERGARAFRTTNSSKTHQYVSCACVTHRMPYVCI